MLGGEIVFEIVFVGFEVMFFECGRCGGMIDQCFDSVLCEGCICIERCQVCGFGGIWFVILYDYVVENDGSRIVK